MTSPLRYTAGTMILGSLTPWASLLGIADLDGLQLHYGWITLLAGTAILTLALDPSWLARHARPVHRRRRLLTTLLAGLSALVCLLVLIGVAHTPYGPAVHATWGLYLTLLAAIGATLSARRTAA